MVRNLFVLSLLSFAVVGCMGPEKGPSPVTDGAASDLVPAASAPIVVTPVLTPEPAPAAAKKAAPTKAKGKLPLNSKSSK
jgi:hypothetical protein